MSSAPDLVELLRNVIAEHDYGITLCSGHPVCVHTPLGPATLEHFSPSGEDMQSLLRRLTGSRGVRELRQSGTTRFIVPFSEGVRLVGAACVDDEKIRIEIRRMVGSE